MPLCFAISRLILAVACGAACALTVSPARAAVPALAPNRAAYELAAAAFAAHEHGRYIEAADLYFQAHQLVPADGAFLYASARSLQLAKQWVLAAVRYQAYLRLETAAADYAAKAKLHLAEVQAEVAAERAAAARAERARAEAVALAAAQTPVDAAVHVTPVALGPSAETLQRDFDRAAAAAQAEQLRRVTLWTSCAVAVLSGVWFAAEWRRRDMFEQAMAPGLSGGKVVGYTDRALAAAEADDIALQQNLAAGGVALGAATALVAWLWPRPSPPPPAVAARSAW